MLKPRIVLALAPLLAVGCMNVPARYRQPLHVYEPQVDGLAVSGFQRTEFVQTGGSFGYVGGNQVFGAASSWSGDYRDFSDASQMRWFLEETQCARQVHEAHNAALRVEGGARGQTRYGFWRTTLDIVETLTLLPLFGLPSPGAADGSATVRLYRNNEFWKSIDSSVRLGYWTTFYTFRSDDGKAAALARSMALRDAADQVAAELCQKPLASDRQAGHLTEPSARKAPRPNEYSLQLHDIQTGEILEGSFGFVGTTTGPVTIPMKDGETLRGEYSTASGGGVNWGGIYRTVYARADVATVSSALRGRVVAVGERGAAMQCEYVTNSSRESPQGHGACRDNHGKVYRLMFGEVGPLSARPE